MQHFKVLCSCNVFISNLVKYIFIDDISRSSQMHNIGRIVINTNFVFHIFAVSFFICTI